MSEEEIKADANYIEEGDVNTAFSMLTNQIHGIKDKVDSFIDANTPDEVKQEKAKHRTPTVADLEDRDEKLVKRLKSERRLEKAGEALAKDAGETISKAVEQVESLFKANEMEFNKTRQKRFDSMLNDISKPYIKKATDKTGFIDTSAVPWDKILEEALEEAKENWGLEDEELEDEDVEDEEEFEEEDDVEVDEDDDEIESRVKKKKKKRGSRTAGAGVSISSNRDFTQPGAIKQLLKDIPKMTREDATAARMELEDFLSRRPDLHRKVFNRGKVKQ